MRTRRSDGAAGAGGSGGGVTVTRIFIRYLDTDVTKEVTLRNGKALPTGWSQYELWHKGRRFGWVENGKVCDLDEGYSHQEVIEEER